MDVKNNVVCVMTMILYVICVWCNYYESQTHSLYEIPCTQWVPLRPHIIRVLELDETGWVLLHNSIAIIQSLTPLSQNGCRTLPECLLILLIGTTYNCMAKIYTSTKPINIWSQTIILGEKTPGVGQSFQDGGSTMVYIVLWTNRCIHDDVQN